VQVMLDGEHSIEETLEVAQNTWAETFKYMADNKVMFEVRRHSLHRVALPSPKVRLALQWQRGMLICALLSCC
jgi:Fructose-bisphosphate aldolase class-I